MSNSSTLETFQPSSAISPHAPGHRRAHLEGSSGKIQFSAKGRSTALVPFWNFCSAAGRANEGLRAGWREHLQLASKWCGFRYLRFHGLLHDDMFVCRRQDGKLVFNWQYVDELIDALLANGVRPFVEFGFFPKDLAGESDIRCFWWQAHVTPPEHYGEWCVLVDKLVRHLSSVTESTRCGGGISKSGTSQTFGSSSIRREAGTLSSIGRRSLR